MNNATSGWIVFASAMGLMLGMIAIDITALMEWSQMSTPLFVGTTLGHVSATIAAFVGGKLIPTSRDTALRTRSDDKDK